jgi:ADP-ribose pyrophosphatase YjhB (NUDIX family)
MVSAGGRVNPGEELQDAARRETRDETGVDIDIKGILRTEYTPSKTGICLQVNNERIPSTRYFLRRTIRL